MTNTALAHRLLKLEANGPKGDLADLTYDELQVFCLEIAKAIPSSDEPSDAEERDEREKHIAEIEADITHTARKQASAEYAQHLDYCRFMWRKRTGRDDYVPALTGGGNGGMGEYHDWDKPRVLERRKVLRFQIG